MDFLHDLLDGALTALQHGADLHGRLYDADQVPSFRA
jgi:hypothetical protein